MPPLKFAAPGSSPVCQALEPPLLVFAFSGVHKAGIRGVANVVPAPVDGVGNQKRMVLLPKIVGEKDFLQSTSPTFRDRLVEKRMCEDRFEGPCWKQKEKRALHDAGRQWRNGEYKGPLQSQVLGQKPKYVLGISQDLDPLDTPPEMRGVRYATEVRGRDLSFKRKGKLFQLVESIP
ncbi:hypothetical protein TNCV_559401 [Trichonephila clavipes]|nr:hypothetical protein TNCV_559401 [Trichonephila clavipes]